jgi:hypothetical protein
MALLIEREDRREAVRLRITLPPDIAEDLAAYAAMTESTANHVMTESLRHVFDRDKKELREYKNGHEHIPGLAENLASSSPKAGQQTARGVAKTLVRMA